MIADLSLNQNRELVIPCEILICFLVSYVKSRCCRRRITQTALRSLRYAGRATKFDPTSDWEGGFITLQEIFTQLASFSPSQKGREPENVFGEERVI